jgi:hypothetical protein
MGRARFLVVAARSTVLWMGRFLASILVESEVGVDRGLLCAINHAKISFVKGAGALFLVL